ncbi:hypothetical protein T458_13560 [Brevibacillus panacihumi W25]|uniref:Uncharacterized protein n=1 Tax=Brevibacillus panacihumi W25 TaxID=1408254 RepID=V6M7W3_9BACL|nr:hypothetical protein [Brevibacillus panacihumi]EST54604.1 hypothetical protein T458_13560 [Brevibacillus panacihumi W25]
MFRNGKRVIFNVLSGSLIWSVLVSGTIVYAKDDNDSDANREVGSYSVGKLYRDSDSKFPKFQKEQTIEPFSSSVVYKQDGFVRRSLTAEKNGTDRDYFLVHRADVEVIDGTEITYKFMKSIKKTSETSHSLETGVRAQGGNKFITELEGHIDYSYVAKEVIEYSRGTETNISVNKPGDYTIYFYSGANRYNLYADWYGYTRDNPKERKLKRYVGDVFEANTDEYIKPKRNR